MQEKMKAIGSAVSQSPGKRTGELSPQMMKAGPAKVTVPVDGQTGVLVIGGGATGAGILWDLSLRGIDAVLVEQRELAYGTTGRCHGLLHSGGRYVVRDGDVARECYQENQILRRVAAGAIEETVACLFT
ncbi:MAG: FAD-dependent oxidoreductase [Syntrophaceticus schinkii]